MKRFYFIFFILILATSLQARRNNVNKGVNNLPSTAAGCSPAVAQATLHLNNVRTRIEATGGSMWQDRANSIADYEIPKRSNASDPKFTSIYAGSLWLGGKDINGQLKLSAVTFRTQGNDFWPGPLDNQAEVNSQTCTEYDRFYGVSRPMVAEFAAYHDCLSDPNCDASIEFPGYQIPDEILNWPAHGDISIGQDWMLAPFYDADGDNFYDPNAGDYPRYDLTNEINCRTDRDPFLFGDTTIWFVFNDKGDPHTETQGASIGMEIRGQAFAFATNDEVNDMTFYNYELINKSSFTLVETYFGQWVDADLGNSIDDYVGCDASRGLGYCYNGFNIDENNGSQTGYGATPPAVGIDFFEGPYQDPDSIDNPLTQDVQVALANGGIPYSGLGTGYGDGEIDNERYGMRKFVYYNNTGGPNGDPQTAEEYYSYLKGIWRDGSNMVWGGTGHFSSPGASNVLADLLFPGDSDPLNWSTQGVPVAPSNWSEFNEGIQPGDRRFLQSAGPFTLRPGARNDLTVGVVWARAQSGNNWSSVQALRLADDKAQALFDNCFEVVEGPTAPEVTFQELNQELILYLTNKKSGNNFNETYRKKNPFIAIPDTLNGVYYPTETDKDTLKFYEFQGYQIYQVKNGQITVSELNDVSKARLLAQVDVEDGVSQLINYTFDPNLNDDVPREMVNGSDEGIRHSFRITTDLFATGTNRLVNHKTYYYIAIAYGYNEYSVGHGEPYIPSRNRAGNKSITSFSAIPHNPTPENGGTYTNSNYGDMPQITRVEGKGNGGYDLELTPSSETTIVANGFMDYPKYQPGKGPIQVKVIDPLNVKAGVYRVQFRDTTTPGNLSDAFWTLHLPFLLNGRDSINSDQLITLENEQLFLDLGISITIKHVNNPGTNKESGNGFIGASIEYKDPSKRWLTGYRDQEGQFDGNWIRSGNSVFDAGGNNSTYNDHSIPINGVQTFIDPEQIYEGVLNGTWAPYRMVSHLAPNNDPNEPIMFDAVGHGALGGASISGSYLDSLSSVDIVFTSDKSKWSRAVVLEANSNTVINQGDVSHLEIRDTTSTDKNGKHIVQAGYNASEGDLVSDRGMGWFPGYAINVETGERLNIAFAEDSWLSGENGRDMVWNPTEVLTAGVNSELRMGGKHYVYVFRNGLPENLMGLPNFPTYDHCSFLYKMLDSNVIAQMYAFRTCIWAGVPMLEPGHTLLETDAKVKLRVEKPYEIFETASNTNSGLPMYEFDMSGMEVEIGSSLAMDSTLSIINVVPNPYYAYSEYEDDKLDRRIKVTNLPQECTISIYNVNGTLMRRFIKGDPKTSLDWNLTNHVNIPVASGVYLIHVSVPDVGERTLKWFGVMKPTDLEGFN